MYTAKHYFGTDPDERNLANFICAMAQAETEECIVFSNMSNWVIDTLKLPYAYFRNNISTLLHSKYKREHFHSLEFCQEFVAFYKAFAVKMLTMVKVLEQVSQEETDQPLGLFANAYPKGYFDEDWEHKYKEMLAGVA